MLAPKPPILVGVDRRRIAGMREDARRSKLFSASGRCSSISTNLSKSRARGSEVAEVLEANRREARVGMEHRADHVALRGELHQHLEIAPAERAAAEAVREDDQRQPRRALRGWRAEIDRQCRGRRSSSASLISFGAVPGRCIRGTTACRPPGRT